MPQTSSALAALRQRMAQAYLADETAIVKERLAEATLTDEQRVRADALARDLVTRVRANRSALGGIDAFLQEYALSTEEGIVLMCLAEALLRVPDSATADALIRDKIGGADWKSHLGKSDSLFVNASTWALMLTGRIMKLEGAESKLSGAFNRLVTRSSEPVIRQSMLAAMRIMGEQFVLGRTIQEALRRAAPRRAQGYCYSFDMLGEAAWTADDAERYFESYEDALGAVAADQPRDGRPIEQRDSISVKLSALHPRYEWVKRDRVLAELLPRVLTLCEQAQRAELGLTIDAEEADRLDLMLDVFEALARHPAIAGWNGLGLAVQAYQKRGRHVIAWLAELARETGRRFPVRLVKGAYWDTEVKRAQEGGHAGYPVFTRKASTDVSYLACARALLAAPEAFAPQFATHNALTLATITAMAGNARGFELQKLHGMGHALYDQVAGDGRFGVPVRVYAPVGGHEDLLAYLVRRLLENGANTSFVNRLADDEAPIADIVADPVDAVARLDHVPHPRIPLPADLFGERRNSRGIVLSDPAAAGPLLHGMQAALAAPQTAAPIIGGKAVDGSATPVRDPSDRRRIVGTCIDATPADADRALSLAAAAQPAWDRAGGPHRAAILERAADLFEHNLALLMGLCVREAGKTLSNAQGEIREAVDFLRYYAAQARAEFSQPLPLLGPTGERNHLVLAGRGVFACISPWNFPLAIFTGQIAAALAAGNAVVAKPAEQTPLVAAAAVRLLHQAGVAGDVLHLLPGPGHVIGAALVADRRIAGVCFTGSTETARLINAALAAREGPIVPLIAETGGQNAMIVDSTALPEQVVRDALASSFDSAGQRCSALRVLFVQKEIAPRVIDLLAGALDELTLGDPMDLATDIGPVIDEAARDVLEAHAQRIVAEGRLVREARLDPEKTGHGVFFAPRIVEIDGLGRLTREVFGPVLHVVRYDAQRLGEVCDAINATGYGLTLSVHSRIESTITAVRDRVRVGNLYVNRNQIGAVVGVQPFGGEGLSGTGPKAGGPHYLHRFALERTVTVNTTASGGNTALLSLTE